jgi:hypothetical protein
MASKKRKDSRLPLLPDRSNDNPFRGLPSDFPLTHSRFPITPSADYGDLSFDPAIARDVNTERPPADEESNNAWRDAMKRALGDIVSPSSDDDDFTHQ